MLVEQNTTLGQLYHDFGAALLTIITFMGYTLYIRSFCFDKKKKHDKDAEAMH